MGNYRDLLGDVLDTYEYIDQIPKSTKEILASKYLAFLADSGQFVEILSYTDLHKSYDTEVLGEMLSEVVYPHEKYGKVIAANQLYERCRRHALRMFDKVLESEFKLHKKGKIYEFKKRST